MYKVEVSHRYVYDMNACLNYISDVLCNGDAAIKLKNKADATINEIAKNPYIYSSYISNIKLKNEYRKAKVNKYYIFFRIDEERKVISSEKTKLFKLHFLYLARWIFQISMKSCKFRN